MPPVAGEIRKRPARIPRLSHVDAVRSVLHQQPVQGAVGEKPAIEWRGASALQSRLGVSGPFSIRVRQREVWEVLGEGESTTDGRRARALRRKNVNRGAGGGGPVQVQDVPSPS